MKQTIIRSLSLIVSAIIISFGMSLAVKLHWNYVWSTEFITTEEITDTDDPPDTRGSENIYISL